MDKRGTSGTADHTPAATSVDELQQQINKRHTLNTLIQGAAMHSFLTGHHLVSDRLRAIDPRLVRLYDRFSVGLALNYFIGDILLVFGLPSRFWRRTGSKKHPLARHRFLATHGHELWLASKRSMRRRALSKWVVPVPGLHMVQMIWLYAQTMWRERGRQDELARIAEEAVADAWDIDRELLVGSLTKQVAFGRLRPCKTRAGRMIRAAAIGYGGVQRVGDRFVVIGRSHVWPLVFHELTKGVAELVCLHGLNELDAETYDAVVDETDQLEYETWQLQAGAELWRRFLEAMPPGRRMADVLMHVARLTPGALDRVMIAVVTDTKLARSLIAEHC